MKRIAFLYDHVLDYGGVERHLLSLMRHLNHEKYQCLIISRTSASFKLQCDQLGIRVIEIPYYRPVSLHGITKISGLIRNQAIDILHIHGAIASTYGRIAAFTHKTPCVVTFHLPACDYHGTRSTIRAAAGRSLYVWIDTVLNHFIPAPRVYVSQKIMEHEINARHAPAKGSIAIPNGIDIGHYQRPSTPHPVMTFLFVGRLDKQKGVDVLIEAAHQLAHHIPEFQILLAGDGPERNQLERLAQRLGLRQVVFLGKREDIPDLLASADVFVLPSRYEGMPFALLEAMAAGLPCLATNVGDVNLMLDGGQAGIVIPPESSGHLADEMYKLILSPQLRQRLGEAAKNRATFYTEQKVVDEVQNVYKKLLTSKTLGA